MEPSPKIVSSRRDFIRNSLITASSLALPSNAATNNTTNPTPTAQENQREGARDWQLTRIRLDRDGFRSPWVEGYCSRQSVQAGQRIDIMVSADPARRVLLQVSVDDAAAADALFSTLMGEDVESRRTFIQRNAHDVRFLDI